MKKTLLIMLLIFLASCSIPKERPSDFQLLYDWQTGSLPPPYFYSFTIMIGTGLEGTLTFFPDYSMNYPPTWIENFPVSESDLDQIYASLHEVGAFAGDWRQQEDIPVGGSADDLSIVAYGQTYSIPSYIEGEERAKAIKEVYRAIEALVPQEIWDKITVQHEQYIQEHADEE